MNGNQAATGQEILPYLASFIWILIGKNTGTWSSSLGAWCCPENKAVIHDFCKAGVQDLEAQQAAPLGNQNEMPGNRFEKWLENEQHD